MNIPGNDSPLLSAGPGVHFGSRLLCVVICTSLFRQLIHLGPNTTIETLVSINATLTFSKVNYPAASFNCLYYLKQKLERCLVNENFLLEETGKWMAAKKA